ncbi:MAG TPA: PhzF family phenazine biosynthesis protein [Candidatus Saccharimonadia bacterium]|nr:PhzF family phenazine biosynthesis protein [Candidatus Saccharimonadia bacterium]
MSKLENLYIVNAFTANGENGNPAGVMLNADGLDEQSMLAIASKVGLSETAFVAKSDRATRKVRFFTPTVEVPLCGHATIATWSLLHKLGELSAGTYTQETHAGLLRIEIQESGLTFMEQTEAQFFDEAASVEIANMLGIQSDDFHAILHPQIVSTGIKDLLVPLADKSSLAKLSPNLDAIAKFSREHDISGFHVFALLEEGESLASARNFAPADGIPEECATGTSNGALLCYLKHKGTLPAQNSYRIEQGEAMGQLSNVYGSFRDGIVWIGGEAEVMDHK